MTNQTRDLIQSLPHFADMLEAYDEDGSSKWEIVQWENIEPQDVKPHQVHHIASLHSEGQIVPNQFSSRTDALRFNAKHIRASYAKKERNERDHWGVWRIIKGDRVVFRTILPTKGLAGSTAPSVRSDAPSAPAMMTVTVREDAYQILRRLAVEESKTLHAVLDEAIREHDRRRFFERADAAYRVLRDDPPVREEQLQERTERDAELIDGLDTEEQRDAVAPRQASADRRSKSA